MLIRYLFVPILIRSGSFRFALIVIQMNEKSLQIVQTRYISWIFHIWTCQNYLKFTVVPNIEMLNCKMLTF